ncbi:hypothetical protein R1sor_015886 [Riccia sorocarpa]|uniref:Uncharacterized protein n=1 Tax=Riccia sorocarpa TaxID=122646 RepID=A0ABD3HGL6_9MARC
MGKLLSGSRSAAVGCSSSLELNNEPRVTQQVAQHGRNVFDFEYLWHLMNVSAGMLLSLSSTSMAAAFPPHSTARKLEFPGSSTVDCKEK